MIAAFLGLRLYSVLGRRAEHEEEPIPGRFDDQSRGRRHAVAGASATLARRRPQLPAGAAMACRGARRSNGACARLRRLTAGSTLLAFLEGARGAYRMVLEAFWRGDKEELAPAVRCRCLRRLRRRDRRARRGRRNARQPAGPDRGNDDRRRRAMRRRWRGSRCASPPISPPSPAMPTGKVMAGSLDDAIEADDVWTFPRNVLAPVPTGCSTRPTKAEPRG